MRVLELELYGIDELDEVAKKKAVDWYRDNVVSQDSDLLHMFSEDAVETCRAEGFNDVKIQYSLSWSQGDGLSFSCTDMDLEKMIKGCFPDTKKSVLDVLKNNIYYKISGNTGHYCYAKKDQVDVYFENNFEYPNLEKMVEKLLAYVEDKYMDLCKRLEKQGYDELEYRYKDETIIEDLRSNEYEFTKEGRHYP